MLLVEDERVTLSRHVEGFTGNAISAIGGLLLDVEISDAFIAGVKLYDTLATLNELMKNVPGWRIRFTNRRRYAFTNQGQRCVTGRFFVDYFSIDSKRGRDRIPRKRIDVINLDLLREKPPTNPESQLEMAIAVLEMCDNRGIKYKATRGALGNAMLKASPQWEHGRYAAPKFINDKARAYLPGNFYSLSSKVEKKSIRSFKHCYYIDQSASHHSIARQILLPHPQFVHARGNWKKESGPWIKPESDIGQEILTGETAGLFLCKVLVVTPAPTRLHLYPPWAQKRGNKFVWLWTPEFRLLTDNQHIQLEYIVSGFSSSERDLVLPEYASWSIDELAREPARADYKKGSLLSAYGMLAFNSVGKNIYRYWGGDNSRPKCKIPIAGMVAESKITIPDNVQLSTVNVIARGLIEAESRTRSLEYAKELTDQGFHIPQIYADGVLVETEQLPFVPEGWRVTHSLTNVHIPRPNAIVSDQMVKLPGVSGSEDDREWEQRRQEARRVVPVA